MFDNFGHEWSNSLCVIVITLYRNIWYLHSVPWFVECLPIQFWIFKPNKQQDNVQKQYDSFGESFILRNYAADFCLLKMIFHISKKSVP